MLKKMIVTMAILAGLLLLGAGCGEDRYVPVDGRQQDAEIGYYYNILDTKTGRMHYAADPLK